MTDLGKKILGTVRYYDLEKGYGFIFADPMYGGEEYFMHFSAVELEGYRSLEAGQRVKFNGIKSAQGFQAYNCEKIE